MYIWHKKIIYSFFLIALLFNGCGSQKVTTSENAIQEGQVKDYSTGKGIENVKVSIGSKFTLTDRDGFYTLTNITPNTDVTINFEKDEYLLSSTKLNIQQLSDNDKVAINYLEYHMVTHTKQWDYESYNNISDININMQSSIYEDIKGDEYNGKISANLYILNPTTDKGKIVFPGSFKGIRSNKTVVPFISYGLISLDLYDLNHHKIILKEGFTMNLIFDAIKSLKHQNIIPLWYYNYTKGIWQEEGYAELQADGTYKGEVTHPGTWTIAKIIDQELGTYRGRLIHKDGTAVQNTRVFAIGNNWVTKDLLTDKNGEFEINVIPDEDFKLSAYDQQNKYGANYNGIIPSIAPGAIVEH